MGRELSVLKFQITMGREIGVEKALSSTDKNSHGKCNAHLPWLFFYAKDSYFINTTF